MRLSSVLYSIIFLAIIVAYSSVFVVVERQKALVLQFGQIRDIGQCHKNVKKEMRIFAPLNLMQSHTYLELKTNYF